MRFTPAGLHAAEIWPALPAEIEARWRERFGDQEVDALRRRAAGRRRGDRHAVARVPSRRQQYAGAWRSSFPPSRRGRRADDLSLITLARACAHGVHDRLREWLAGLPAAERERPAGARRDGRAGAGAAGAHGSFQGGGRGVVDASVEDGVRGGRGRARIEANDPRHARGSGPPGGSASPSRPNREAVGRGDLRTSLEHILGHPDLSAGLRPHPGGWRASKPYAQQTEAVLADPRGALPHYPMVLHRGGWPDGS